MTATAPLYMKCRRCDASVLEVRWDWQMDTLIGSPRLDPVALDYQQITACIITGVPLWQLHQRLVGGWLTSRRTRWWPTGPMPGHVVPEHACGACWDAFPVDLSTVETVYPDKPPF